MAIEQMSANDLHILGYIYDNYRDFPDQNKIAQATKLSISQISRSVYRHEKRGYIRKIRIGKHQSWKPNKNKKFEVLSLLRVYKICKQDIESGEKNILRIHDLEYYFKCFVPSNYDKSLFVKRFPAGNRVVLLMNNGLFKAEIHLKEIDSLDNTAQIFPNPFFLPVSFSISNSELDELLSLECCRRLKAIEEMIEDDGLNLEEQIKVSNGEVAVSDSWNARLAVKHGLYNKHLDNSLKNNFGEEEYSYEDALNILPASLAIQDFCAEKNIDQAQFNNMFIRHHAELHGGSPIPVKPQYYFSGNNLYSNTGSAFI